MQMTKTIATALRAMVAATLLVLVPFAQAGAKQNLVFFGDSLSDTGNRFYDDGIKNTPPYDLVAADGLVPSFPYAIGGATYTNGAVWVEYFARALGQGGASEAALRSDGIAANYAYGGARASNAAPLIPNSNRNLTDQVSAYLADVNSGISEDTLHVVYIGGNDVAEAIRVYVSPPPLGPAAAAQVIANAVGSLAYNVVDRLHGSGAQRFLIVNAPNAGAVPLFRPFGPGAVVLGGILADNLNAGLQAFVIDVLVGLGADVTVLDSHTLFDEISQNPAAFGIENTSDHCVTPLEPPYQCQFPNTYMYWDNIHPTAAVHKILADTAIALMSP